MRTKLLASATAVALSATMAIGISAPAAYAAPPSAVATQRQLASVAPATINQTIANVGTFVGTFTPTSFSSTPSELNVTGVLNGTFTAVDGTVTQITNQTTTTNVIGGQDAGGCTILTLNLGPLDLDVLGLIVELDEVNLVIRAERGSGNLLGNLLCAIAGLLDGGNTGGLGNLLNRLLGL